jgi:hypothetical protein
MMDMIRRDEKNILDAMLVAINANDKLNFNMQNNVISVAMAKTMGVIGMKVFADGAMYTKEANWSREPKHVVRTVGSDKLPSRPLIEYSLSTPGLSTAIIGIGQVSDDHSKCQLTQNISSAQIKPNGLSETERSDIEKLALNAKEGKTNYFQVQEGGLTKVTDANVMKMNDKSVKLSWNTAYAGKNAIKSYEIFRDNEEIGKIDHKPQIVNKPFTFIDQTVGDKKCEYKIISVDTEDQRAETSIFIA